MEMLDPIEDLEVDVGSCIIEVIVDDRIRSIIEKSDFKDVNDLFSDFTLNLDYSIFDDAIFDEFRSYLISLEENYKD